MGTRTLNLNNYEVCSDGDATLKMVPFKMSDGAQPPVVYLKHKGRKGGIKAGELATTEWEPNIKLDVFQGTTEYKQCVYWWFKQATSEFKDALAGEYTGLYTLDNLSREILKIKNWLTENAGFRNNNGKYTKRKIKLSQFIRTWLNKNSTFKFGK